MAKKNTPATVAAEPAPTLAKRKTVAAPTPTPAPATVAAAVAAAPTVAAPAAPKNKPKEEYIRTREDIAAVDTFKQAATAYDRASHTFAVAAYRMLSTGLHEREGCRNFGDWCAIQYTAAGIRNVDGRRTYQLAQIGEVIATSANPAAFDNLSSNAILAIAQNRDALKKHFPAAEDIAAFLPDYMESQGIGNSMTAVEHLAEHGPDGDQRTEEERDADANDERYANAVEIAARTIGSIDRVDDFAEDVRKEIRARERKKAKKGRRSRRED